MGRVAYNLLGEGDMLNDCAFKRSLDGEQVVKFVKVN